VFNDELTDGGQTLEVAGKGSFFHIRGLLKSTYGGDNVVVIFKESVKAGQLKGGPD
jgi:hypothetical protein